MKEQSESSARKLNGAIKLSQQTTDVDASAAERRETGSRIGCESVWVKFISRP